MNSPSVEIPDREELKSLWQIILTQPDLRREAVPRHHRGALYWHAIDQGWSQKDALEMALSPEAGAVEYEIVEVDA